MTTLSHGSFQNTDKNDEMGRLTFSAENPKSKTVLSKSSTLFSGICTLS